ncbi:MAG: ATP-binding protein [Bacteroidota bacterium]
MTLNQIILFSFFTIVAIILASGYLRKIYHKKLEKKKTLVPQGPRKIDFELKGDIFELSKLAIILEDLERYEIPVKTIFELNVIIEEIFSGIVTRHQEGVHDNKIIITLILELGQIMVCIKDNNDEFDPTVIPAIDLNAPIEEISFQGLGFHMIRHLADQLSYQRLDGQNVLSLRKTYKS